MDIQSAFADGPFGSGAKSDTDKPEPSESTEATTEQRDAGGEAPVEAKADSNAGARDEHSDDDGEGRIDGPPGSEGLQKALKSERSLRREQRKGLSEALKRSEQLEAQNRQFQAELAAIRQQMVTSAQQQAPQKTEPEPGFFELGPEAYTQREAARLAQEQANKVAQQFLPQIERLHRQRLDDAEEAFTERVTDGREHINHFAQLTRETVMLPNGQSVQTDHARRLIAEFNAVVRGEHPHYTSPVKFAYEYAKAARQAVAMADPNYEQKLREKWEAEKAGSGQAANGSREASGWSAPKTLAGRRGGGSSVTPASAGAMSIDQAFRF